MQENLENIFFQPVHFLNLYLINLHFWIYSLLLCIYLVNLYLIKYFASYDFYFITLNLN